MSSRTVIRDIHDYTSRDLAATHKSTAGTQPAADPAVIATAWEQVEREGYAVIESVLSAETIAEVRAEMVRLLSNRTGRNNFEGFATRRVYAVLEKTWACDALVAHPIVLALLDRVLLPNYLLSQLQMIDILPGEAQQPIHHDDAIYPWQRPRPPLGGAAIWSIDAFTEDNGATVVMPGSHLWDARDPNEEDIARQRSIVMPPGSVLFLLGTTWHAGGANRSNAERFAVAAQYCAPWCRQQESYGMSVPRERVKSSSEDIQRLIGYSIHPPFMGFVNGMHPKRLLE